MVKILIPTPLRPFTGRQAEVEVEGTTVGEAMTALTTRYPELKRHLYSNEGKLRSFVNLFVGDEDVRHQQGEATALAAGTVLSIVPSIAGGAPEPLARPTSVLNKEEIARYSRHLIMPEVGMDGQRRLKNASVLLIGTGGLGAPSGSTWPRPGSAGSDWSTSTWSTPRICNARSSTAPRTSAEKSSTRRATGSPTSTPTSGSKPTR